MQFDFVASTLLTLQSSIRKKKNILMCKICFSVEKIYQELRKDFPSLLDILELFVGSTTVFL